MEPYQAWDDLQERIEHETQRILKGCPVCPRCGNTVDTIGVYAGEIQYVEYNHDYYHVPCFKKWVKKDPEHTWQLAEEFIDDFMTITKG